MRRSFEFPAWGLSPLKQYCTKSAMALVSETDGNDDDKCLDLGSMIIKTKKG